MLSPILMKLAAPEANEKSGSGAGVDLVTVDTDEQGDLAMQYEVSHRSKHAPLALNLPERPLLTHVNRFLHCQQ